MDFCPQCGSPIEPGARFCGNCGLNIRPASGQRPVWLFVVGIAAVIAAGVVGILALGGGDEGGDAPPAASSTSTAPPAGPPSSTPPAPAATGPVVPVGISWESAGSCRGAPAPVVARNWQTSAPRDGVAPGDNAEVWIRNKDGALDRSLAFDGPIYVTVIDPSGSDRWTTRTVLNSVQTAAVVFPHDFPDGPGIYGPGPYTIVWSTDSGYLACDGFLTIGE